MKNFLILTILIQLGNVAFCMEQPQHKNALHDFAVAIEKARTLHVNSVSVVKTRKELKNLHFLTLSENQRTAQQPSMKIDEFSKLLSFSDLPLPIQEKIWGYYQQNYEYSNEQAHTMWDHEKNTLTIETTDNTDDSQTQPKYKFHYLRGLPPFLRMSYSFAQLRDKFNNSRLAIKIPVNILLWFADFSLFETLCAEDKDGNLFPLHTKQQKLTVAALNRELRMNDSGYMPLEVHENGFREVYLINAKTKRQESTVRYLWNYFSGNNKLPKVPRDHLSEHFGSNIVISPSNGIVTFDSSAQNPNFNIYSFNEISQEWKKTTIAQNDHREHCSFGPNGILMNATAETLSIYNNHDPEKIDLGTQFRTNDTFINSSHFDDIKKKFHAELTERINEPAPTFPLLVVRATNKKVLAALQNKLETIQKTYCRVAINRVHYVPSMGNQILIEFGLKFSPVTNLTKIEDLPTAMQTCHYALYNYATKKLSYIGFPKTKSSLNFNDLTVKNDSKSFIYRAIQEKQLAGKAQDFLNNNESPQIKDGQSILAQLNNKSIVNNKWQLIKDDPRFKQVHEKVKVLEKNRGKEEE